MNKDINILAKEKNEIESIIDNIIFLDIETSGVDPLNSEILEIGAIKIKSGKVEIFNTLIKNKREIPIEIYALCSGMNKNDFDSAPMLQDIQYDFIKFVENEIIVCHNSKFIKNFFNHYIPKIKNEIIDSMELAMILEPYHKEYSLDYLKQRLIKNSTNEKNRALYDAIDIINVVNALLLRLSNREKSILEPLSFKINSYLSKFNLNNWRWSRYIDEANYYLNLKIDVKYEDNIDEKQKEYPLKEKQIIKQIYASNRLYEELLKNEEIWSSKEGFIYEYRPGQYELTKTIRETFNGNCGSAKIACIEAPTGIGKSVGYLLPAILEARFNKKRVIISTDTKELQIQLINKDIPNVLNSMGLNGKVSYGYIKGKNNYICVEKLETYKLDYNKENVTESEILSIVYLERLVEEGRYGDIEEINHWVLNHFNNLGTHLRYISCDPNLCRPKKCHKECLYKKRIEELKEEDITIINHSLLAKWPYKEEKPLEHVIVDEAHNLTEKGYEFFSSVIEYKSLKHFLKEIYPYENIQNSPLSYDGNNKKIKKIKMFDKFYNHLRIDRDVKNKISRNINLIYEEINSILDYGNYSEYNGISNYNLRWELNLQEEESAGKLNKDNNYIEISYKNYSEKIRSSCENIIRNLSSILFLIDKYIDDDNLDKESDIYKFGKSRFNDMEDIKTTLQIFMEYDEEDDYARTVEIDKNYKNFELRVIPLKLADLFAENILNQLSSGIFLSATLSVGNNMSYFKNTLGINRVENVEKVIDPLYDYKERVCVIRVDDVCSYKNIRFPKEMSEIISNISQITEGHTLSLFNSKDRQEKTYSTLKENLHDKNIEVYTNKKSIKYLKDINRRCVVLGSKGCFEGVDVPGDGLTCVTLDKIPNINPSDPLYFTIMKKYNKDYYNINYPQMAIKVKQAMGRILRSKYDYGCFIIFNTGTNINILKRLEKDLHGCKILSMSTENIYKYIHYHLNKSRRSVLKLALLDIFKVFNINEDTTIDKTKELINREMENRCIKSKVYHTEDSKSTLKISYFNMKYLINKDKFSLKINKKD